MCGMVIIFNFEKILLGLATERSVIRSSCKVKDTSQYLTVYIPESDTEPARLPSLGSQRVGHDQRDSAAAAHVHWADTLDTAVFISKCSDDGDTKYTFWANDEQTWKWQIKCIFTYQYHSITEKIKSKHNSTTTIKVKNRNDLQSIKRPDLESWINYFWYQFPKPWTICPSCFKDIQILQCEQKTSGCRQLLHFKHRTCFY